MTISYAPEFEFPGGEFQINAQRFATDLEARASAAARFARWTMPVGYGVREMNDPVTYRWTPGLGDERL